jgi:hypothetical protein
VGKKKQGKEKMQTLTKTIDTYNYSELEGTAKDKARSWLAETATNYGWYEDAIEDYKETANLTLTKFTFPVSVHRATAPCLSAAGNMPTARWLKWSQSGHLIRNCTALLENCVTPVANRFGVQSPAPNIVGVITITAVWWLRLTIARSQWWR